MLHKPGSIEYKLDRYLEAKSLAWAPSTLRTETAVLWALLPNINGNALELWNILTSRQKSNHTRTITWGRVIAFWDHAYGSTDNPYREFKDKNKRLFKNSYVRKEVTVTYEEAKKRIQEIKDEATRIKALNLLQNGMRYSESNTEANGTILGKGNKTRKLLLPIIPGPKYTKTYHTFWSELRKVGLTPHMLRKLAATKLVDLGLKEADLLKIFGWNSVQTASLYVQPKRDNELARVMKEAFNG